MSPVWWSVQRDTRLPRGMGYMECWVEFFLAVLQKKNSHTHCHHDVASSCLGHLPVAHITIQQRRRKLSHARLTSTLLQLFSVFSAWRWTFCISVLK